MTHGVRRPQDAGLWRDLAALRRYFWLPLVAVAVAVAAALIIGAVRPDSSEARFRENVVVDALPPLFGPAVLPSPFDYARLATSDSVVQQVADQHGLSLAELRPRLAADVRINRPEIDFKVTGPGALTIARTWREAFAAAAAQQTPDIERLLVQPYARQLDEARSLLEQRAADAKASPDDAVIRQQLVAAEGNFETASKLSQSYDVVARTMRASSFGVAAPYQRSAGVGSRAGRLAAAVAIGLLAGVAGALTLDYAARRRQPELAAGETPAPLRRRVR